MAVEYAENRLQKPSDRLPERFPRNHICFELKNLTQIAFHAPNEMHEINPKTNEYYYDLFVIEFVR